MDNASPLLTELAAMNASIEHSEKLLTPICKIFALLVSGLFGGLGFAALDITGEYAIIVAKVVFVISVVVITFGIFIFFALNNKKKRILSDILKFTQGQRVLWSPNNALIWHVYPGNHDEPKNTLSFLVKACNLAPFPYYVHHIIGMLAFDEGRSATIECKMLEVAMLAPDMKFREQVVATVTCVVDDVNSPVVRKIPLLLQAWQASVTTDKTTARMLAPIVHCPIAAFPRELIHAFSSQNTP